jgi:hypothetical protein
MRREKMINLRDWCVRFLALTLLAGTCFAQNPELPKFYKLDFVVKEVEAAKVMNARSYSMTVSTDPPGVHSSMRTGSRVPFGNTGQVTFLDVGVNIDCSSVKAEQDQLSLTVTAEISSILQESTTPTGAHPIIRQNKWTSSVIVPIKKPTVIFSSDDATSKRQMQLELTATPIK